MNGLEESLDSLLGQLELGLGVGFLNALRTPADEVCEFVLDCVDRDTRLDWHLDERDDYYARLLLEAGAEVATLERLVVAHEPTSGNLVDHSTLPVDVLVRMGVRGSRSAQDALARYLASGVDVYGLLETLQGDGERTARIPAWRATMERLGFVLCERFPSRAQLRSAVEEMRESFSIASDTPPWSLWAVRHPMIGDVLREYDDARGNHPRPVPADLASLSTTELLTLADPTLIWRAVQVLYERTSEADVRSLIAAARFESLPMQGSAIQALAHQGRPEALEIASELCHDTGRVRTYMFRALQLLPYDQTRSLAREWFESDQTVRRRAAANILELRAGAEDLPAIREYLCRDPLDRQTSDLYIICSLALALGRHPDQGPYPELTSVFYGIPYSFGRQHVAKAMAKTDPAFAHTHAIECLWDCQYAIRETGVSRVDTSNPTALARLRVMAADEAEEEETQLGAHARLRDQQPGRLPRRSTAAD